MIARIFFVADEKHMLPFGFWQWKSNKSENMQLFILLWQPTQYTSADNWDYGIENENKRKKTKLSNSDINVC